MYSPAKVDNREFDYPYGIPPPRSQWDRKLPRANQRPPNIHTSASLADILTYGVLPLLMQSELLETRLFAGSGTTSEEPITTCIIEQENVLSCIATMYKLGNRSPSIEYRISFLGLNLSFWDQPTHNLTTLGQLFEYILSIIQDKNGPWEAQRGTNGWIYLVKRGPNPAHIDRSITTFIEQKLRMVVRGTVIELKAACKTINRDLTS